MGKKKPRSGVPRKLPGRRALEATLHNMTAGLTGGRPTALAQAQELIYEAFESPPKRQVELARKALELSPLCADAYVLLFEKGMAAGEQAIGKKDFAGAVGHFWGVLETRPYMRARQGLAHCLWSLGRREEAAGHLTDMLRLNPNDNQGVRYTLVGWLLALDQDQAAHTVLDNYDEDGSAFFSYARVLVAFRSGDLGQAHELLQGALKGNQHVPAYLLDDEPLPRQPPDSYSFGSEEEAVLAAEMLLPAWRTTRGASTWLRGIVHQSRPLKPPAAKGPSSRSVERLLKLPQQDDVWQVDCREMANRIIIEGAKVRPWILLVVNRSREQVLVYDLLDEPAPAARLWDKLAEAMQKPAAGKPQRPIVLEVRPGACWRELALHLKELDIEIATTAELDMLDYLFDDLSQHLCGEAAPGLLDVPGVTPDMAGSFFDAAASFYRQAPWKRFDDEATIKVECDSFKGGPWYGVIMGQAGMTFGLVLYEDLKLLKKLRRHQLSDEENARQTVALTVTYGDETSLPVNDLDAAHQYGWQVAAPEAYPSIFRKERGLTIRPPLEWELQLMDGCLRAFADFGPESGPQSISVPSLTGTIGLRLTLMDSR